MKRKIYKMSKLKYFIFETVKNKKTYIQLFSSILLIIFILSSANIAVAMQNNDDEFLLTTKIENMMSEYDVAGCTITYIKDGKVVLSDGYGNANIFTESKISNESVFEAGSNGKMLVSYICLKLQEEGKIILDKPVVDYIGDEWIEYSDFSKDITIRQLLSHTSGLSNSYELGIDKKIYFEPGTNYKYSGVGYIYLQKIIEKVTGKTFEAVAKQYVFEPLNMNNSSYNSSISNNKVNPHINPKSLAIYMLVPLVVFFLMIYIVMFAIGIKTRFKYYSKITLFKFCMLCACILSSIFSLAVLSKLVIPLLTLFIIGGLVHICIRKYNSDRLYYVSFIILIFIVSVSAFIVPRCIAIGNDIINKKENPAYSLTTTNNDISKFVEELLKVYKSDNQVLKNMFNEQVKIDEQDSWGLGIGIEKVGTKKTYWHSGINPGFQSLIVINGEDNCGVIVLTNSDNGLSFSKEIAKSLLKIEGNWDIKR